MRFPKRTTSAFICLLTTFSQPAWSQTNEDPLPRRGFFGVALAQRADEGVSITAVSENSTASAIGIGTGDVIITIDGESTDSPADVQAAIGSHRGGKTVRIGILRGGEPIELTATLRPLPFEVIDNSTVEYGFVTTDQGIRLRTITSVPIDSTEPAPAVLLIQGGGCGSIDSPWTPMPVGQVQLVHSIASQGFVTMRVEKSGLGDSEGAPCSMIGYAEELAGYRAGLRALKSHPAADPDRIFLLGLSLGGVFAPILANETDVAGISVYSTLARPPYPYAGRAPVFFEEFEQVDVRSAWASIDVPVQLVRGQYDELRAEMSALARWLETTNPAETEYLELEKLDHCWTRHATFEDSIDNCGGGEMTTELSDVIVRFLSRHS